MKTRDDKEERKRQKIYLFGVIRVLILPALTIIGLILYIWWTGG